MHPAGPEICLTAPHVARCTILFAAAGAAGHACSSQIYMGARSRSLRGITFRTCMLLLMRMRFSFSVCFLPFTLL